MKNKKIANIVFYKFNNKGEEKRQACIFYTDGTVENLSYEDGIEACEQLAKDLHITSKDAFKNMINNDIIHVVSGSEFEDRFSDFIVNEEDLGDIEDVFEAPHNAPEERSTDENEDFKNKYTYPETKEDIDENSDNLVLDGDIEGDSPEYPDSEDEASFGDIPTNFHNSGDGDIDPEIEDDLDAEDIDENSGEPDIEDDIEDIFSENIENNEEKPKERKGILGMIERAYKKFKENTLIRRITICVVSLAVGFGIYSVLGRKTKEGVMTTPSIASNSTLLPSKSTSQNSASQNGKISVNGTSVLLSGNNDYYDNYSYEKLLQVTENKSQKKAMKNLGTVINKFNGSFADAHVEKGKDIRAALSFDEIVALQNAYNDYNKKEIKAYFNGADINAADMTKNYKVATLQLMGAHVIETREHPVDMSPLLEDNKAKDFYKRYHEMFVAAKEATGSDKVIKEKIFTDALIKDFPITDEVRTEGIMHSENYDLIESYKLSVVPMIAAAEMMFQNFDIDYTLSDSEIDFINDIGLCNYAQDKFDKIQSITLAADEDNTNPLYEQYRDSVIKMMKDKNQYVTSDKRRDLSALDAFQDEVNWHFYVDSTGTFTGQVYYTTETRTETKTWSTTDTTYREEVTMTEKEIPASEKAKIDKQIAEENSQAKAEAEKKAENKRKRLQEEADQAAKKIKQEVKKDAKDLKDKIDKANDQINDNNKDTDTSNDKKINESDFGDHGVDFDDEHSDSQGNLDNSVENITTNPSGDQTGTQLPDQNETGADFDANAPAEDSNEEDSIINGSGDGSGVEVEDNDAVDSSTNQQTIIEYEESVAGDEAKSNEELVDEYVENLANSSEEELSYDYVK